ncbi:hypothetical protein DER45DRAFT_580498 [Fusarium avenaceum]|nr:hypothetical protein DER45DRAFT_580498 [Fusarium avenaceum]
MALAIILAWHEEGTYDLTHSVINCSFAIAVPFLEAVKLDSSITKLYRSIISYGGNIVASAGNANPNQSKVYLKKNTTKIGNSLCYLIIGTKDNSKPDIETASTWVPMCYEEVILIGNASFNWEISPCSYRPAPMGYAPRNLFVWAPGTDLPGLKDPDQNVTVTGTSFAAPLVSGALASVITLKGPVKPTPGVQRAALQEFLNDTILDQPCLNWWPQK